MGCQVVGLNPEAEIPNGSALVGFRLWVRGGPSLPALRKAYFPSIPQLPADHPFRCDEHQRQSYCNKRKRFMEFVALMKAIEAQCPLPLAWIQWMDAGGGSPELL